MMEFYTVPEIAEILKVDPRTVRTLIQKNEIIALKVGSEYRIANEDFQEFIKKNKTG